MKLSKGLLTFVFTAGVAAASQAVIFSNVTIQSSPLSDGSSWSSSGNAISFFTPNAIVGDPVAPLRFGTLNIQYDADNGSSLTADTVTVNLATALLGSGTIVFNELVFELDSSSNEIGGPIASISQTFTSASPSTWSATLTFSHDVRRLRAKKSFTFSAVDTSALDVAGLAIVNQNLHAVPEPMSLSVLALGALGVIRRRRSN